MTDHISSKHNAQAGATRGLCITEDITSLTLYAVYLSSIFRLTLSGMKEQFLQKKLQLSIRVIIAITSKLYAKAK